jgi:hypothetical protein
MMEGRKSAFLCTITINHGESLVAGLVDFAERVLTFFAF